MDTLNALTQVRGFVINHWKVIAFVISIILIFVYTTSQKKKERFQISAIYNSPPNGYLDLIGGSKIIGNKLLINYPKGSGGDFSIPGGVMGSFTPNALRPMCRRATYTVDVTFSPGFDFGRGGKAGIGLQMGTGQASGGQHSTTAATARVMWRPNGAATAYVYVPYGSKQTDPSLAAIASGNQTYGSEFFINDFPAGTFTPGKKTRVSIRVWMNSPGKTNGTLSLTIGGRTATKTGIMWLNNGNNKEGITKVLMGTFFGGDDWFSPKDQWATHENFKMYSR